MAKRHFYKMVVGVSDLDRSERFYRDDLGLKPVGRDLWPEDGPNTSFQTADGAYVVLVAVPEVEKDGAGVHRNFMMPEEDFHRVYERLDKGGWLRITHRTAMGVRGADEITCGVYDPDRHQIQLTVWAKEFAVPPSGAGRVVAGRIVDFSLDSVSYNKEGKFYLVRNSDGFLALNVICTHRQCNVVYEPTHYHYYCYCHQRRFSRTGLQIALQGRDVPPLHRYEIEFVDGNVVVDTDRSIPRSEEEVDQMFPVPTA